jgi:D-alanyl-D-alanine dipeptidase
MTNQVLKYICLFVLVIVLIASCDRAKEQEVCEEEWEESTSIEEDSTMMDSNAVDEKAVIEKIDTCFLEEHLLKMGLIDVQQVNDRIMVDLRYSSTNNFIGENMYGCLKKAYLQPEVAERLSLAQDYLTENHPDFYLYVFDAVRPISVQQKMWDDLDSIPVSARIKFVSNPKNGSIHNYGAAVDLSIYDAVRDTLLDMGAGFDDMRLIAYPTWEDKFLKEGALNNDQIENRKLLRKAMRRGGFWVLPTEWWHFNAFSRDKAKTLFEPINFSLEKDY